MKRRFAIFLPLLIAAAPATQPGGLDALNDQPMLNELAARGLDDLLQRAFDEDRITPDQQQAIRTLGSLRRLSDPNLSQAERQKLISDVVDKMDAILQAASDNPDLLIHDGRALMEQGV